MRAFGSRGHLDVAKSSMPRELFVYLCAVAGLWALSLIHAVRLAKVVGTDRAFEAIAMANPVFDLLCYTDRFHSLHSLHFFDDPGYAWNYPAPCILLYRFFYKFDSGTQVHTAILSVYGTLVALLLVAGGIKLTQALVGRGLSRARATLFVTGSVIFSWPIYFALERGNIEALLWFGLAAAIYAYVRERWMLAAILLGVVAAFKIYPILCFGLFLRPRRYRELAVGLVSCAATTGISLLYAGPTLFLAARRTARGIHAFLKLYSSMYLASSIGYDHSAFSLVKALSSTHTASIPVYLPRYTLLAGVTAAALFFARTWKMPRPNQVLMTTVMIVLLPSTSFDYTLESLYIPWAWMALLLVAAHRSGRTIRGGMAAMICFGLLMGPETFLVHQGVLFAGQVKAVTLLLLVAISLIFRFEEDSLPGRVAPASLLG